MDIELTEETKMALQKFGQILGHLKRTNGKPDNPQLMHAAREAANVQEGILCSYITETLGLYRFEWEKTNGRALDPRFEDEDYEMI